MGFVVFILNAMNYSVSCVCFVATRMFHNTPTCRQTVDLVQFAYFVKSNEWIRFCDENLYLFFKCSSYAHRWNICVNVEHCNRRCEFPPFTHTPQNTNNAVKCCQWNFFTTMLDFHPTAIKCCMIIFGWLVICVWLFVLNILMGLAFYVKLSEQEEILEWLSNKRMRWNVQHTVIMWNVSIFQLHTQMESLWGF